MKLYATVTSERASKGQGGKELRIEIQGEDETLLWTIYVNPAETGYELKLVNMGDEFPKYRFEDSIAKGEQKKGEEGVCEHLRRTYNCPVCNPPIK